MSSTVDTLKRFTTTDTKIKRREIHHVRFYQRNEVYRGTGQLRSLPVLLQWQDGDDPKRISKRIVLSFR